MSLTVGASETAVPFSEATCQALSGLVLRSSGLSTQSAPPDDFVASLRSLAEADTALAAWAGVTLDSCLHQEAGNSHDPWPTIAAKLPEALIACAPAGGGDSRYHLVWQQLQAVCHVAVRLRTLETRFASELQRKKQEAIYQFAYGLSHELNNPLANIATRGGVLAQQESQPQRKTLLETILANAMRGCEMLGDLMLVARPPKLQFKSTRIDELITAVVEQAQRWAGGLNIEITLDVHSQQNVQLDAAAMREALWALLRNAIEAMPDGGTVKVSVTDVDASRVCIEIADQGSGLSNTALEHCFDPYYSGREAGRGLGLGLSKSLRIIELHHGTLTLANRCGGGAVARIVLSQIWVVDEVTSP
ncbi:MAG: HAMP domain-containing sensor histidine kinase [Aureliella sp.]